MLSGRLQQAQHGTAYRGQHALVPWRIADYFSAIKTRTQSRRMRILAAQATADAAINDSGDRIDFERVGIVFQGQSRAA